ncbi:TPA: permease [Escherichia coli]
MTGQSSSQAATPIQWWKPALFFLVVIAGLWYVKWEPYYGKAFTAAETHSIGKSILAQADANPWQAALDYAMIYFLAVWKAAGMRRQQVSMGGALAFWMGNPVLNPATLVFMGFVLGWGFAAIRLVAGLVMVLLIATLVQKWVRETPQTQAPVEIDIPEAQGGFFSRWGRALWTLFWSTIPVYILAVLVLGAARVWLFPHADGTVDNSLMWVVAMAVAGCLFVIPTAAEIPIVQTMMLAGMGTAPALALLMTLPAVSLPSLIMLRKAFPAKALWLTGAMVAVSGVIVGGLALLF